MIKNGFLGRFFNPNEAREMELILKLQAAYEEIDRIQCELSLVKDNFENNMSLFFGIFAKYAELQIQLSKKPFNPYGKSWRSAEPN